MAEFTNPALPVVVGANTSPNGYAGFGPSDANLVQANQIANSHLLNLMASKDAHIASVETRHQIERAVKESELATERAVNKIQSDVSNMRAELQSQIQVASAESKAAIASMSADAKSSALTASDVELLIRKLLVVRTGTSPVSA